MRRFSAASACSRCTRGQFLGGIFPLDHRTDALALGVADRIDDQVEGTSANLEVGLVGALEIAQHVALMRRDSCGRRQCWCRSPNVR